MNEVLGMMNDKGTYCPNGPMCYVILFDGAHIANKSQWRLC